MRGLQGAEVEAECMNIMVVARSEKLAEYDLIGLRAPPQYITASKPMKTFSTDLKEFDLKGKCGFGFDTKLDYFMAGSATKFIEKKLTAHGFDIIRPHCLAIVIGPKEKEKKKKEGEIKIIETMLKEELEEVFETVGKELETLLESKARKVEAR